ncbi:MAG: transketolase [Rhabdochlamydiaceae bacterium]
MDVDLKKNLSKVANTIRQLSIEAVQKANSGHPGLPMGCAEFGAYLYGHLLRHNPKNPNWLNRDRFVLSAGHGSMFLYSCLFLAGFDLSLEDIKNFRQLHSKTPGHPEYGMTAGVEATTGPLGQGVGNAVGQALGLKLLQKKFNTDKHHLFDSKVYCLAGDGCLMEGVSSEASSLAGHLNLNNLILIHDANKITLDGDLSESCSEDTKMRYKSYGWDVFDIDGYDFDGMDQLFQHFLKEQKKPILIQMHTIIGKGSPHKAGSHKVHGSPLGQEELEATKKALGLPEEAFYVPQAVYNLFAQKQQKDQALEEQWLKLFHEWKEENPSLYEEFVHMQRKDLPENLEDLLNHLSLKSPQAGRAASQHVINLLSTHLPYLYGGSADLSGSDCTMIKDQGIVSTARFDGRNIKYGVREFGMATIANGLSQTGMILPFIGTFLTFSDYMRNAIRLAGLSHIQVIYQFTHDSIFLGEDGPTHQPVEHYAALRAIPGLHVYRPADNHEVKMSWIGMLKYKGPSAILLSRQNLADLEGTQVSYGEGVGRGAYIIKKEKEKIDFTFFATGSEVSLALDTAKALETIGKGVRVISIPCWELFDEQPEAYKQTILGGDLGKRVSFEAGISLGWHRFVGLDGICISIDSYGASAPMNDLAQEYGFTVEAVLNRLLARA